MYFWQMDDVRYLLVNIVFVGLGDVERTDVVAWSCGGEWVLSKGLGDWGRA